MENNIWRGPTEEDHRAVLKRIKKSAILNCSLLGFGAVFCLFIDFIATRHYIIEGYSIVLILLIQILLIGTIFFFMFLMKDFIRRFSHIIKKEYEVTDCIITDKRREVRYRNSHHYVSIIYGGSQQEELFTEADIFYDAQIGNEELVIRYIEKNNDEKVLPDDLIIKLKD